MGSKTVRRIPDVVLEWLEKKHGKEFANWYQKNAYSGKSQVTAERQSMSAEAGKIGAYHEGHFKGAMDVDPKLGGGPTTGLTMRPEIGAVNIAHKELPRIDYEEMVQAGIPQNWIEDIYETVLESEGMGVIGSYDTQAAMDMDAGDVTPGQARAQSDRRRQLREQGVKQVGSDTKVKFKPAPTPELNRVPLPNIVEGVEKQREIESKQIANRRSNRAVAKGKKPPVKGTQLLNNLRAKAALGAAAGLTGISILGTGASAAETATRTQIADQTGDLTDKIQAGIAGVSLTADLASYSGVGAVPGALVSSGADAANMIIDQIRFGANNQRIRGRSGAQRALQQQQTTP